MNSLRRLLFPILLFAFCSVWQACGSSDKELVRVNEILSAEQLSIETAKDVEILYSDSAVVRVRIQGARLLNYLDRNQPRQEFPDGIKIDFFDLEKNIQSTLTAKYALRDLLLHQVFVRDSVVWKSKKKETLETEELIWDERRGDVRSAKFVKMTKPNEVIVGYGFQSNQDFTRWEIIAPKGYFPANNIAPEDL